MEDECGCGMNQWRHDNYCGCGMHGREQGYKRRSLTKTEKIEKLKDYSEELKKELKAVEEKIKDMQG